MDATERTPWICGRAAELGFCRAGVARAGPPLRIDYVEDWLRLGRHGEMNYLEKWHHLRTDPRRLLAGARSIIVVADNYRQRDSGSKADSTGARVAQYAWGRDYHRVIRRKLEQLVADMHDAIPEWFETRICVDTAPLIEREFAAAAGIGWIGKNTLVMHQELGSYFFLGAIVTTLELVPTPPTIDHCGTCTRCLDACPTGALDQPYQMDATRCISYLTIEHRGPIDAARAVEIGDWLYGCDICQEVCPHNRKAPASTEPAYAPLEHNPLAPSANAETLLEWTPDAYTEALRGSAMKRASLDMLRRNAEIVLRNRANHQPPTHPPIAASGAGE